jgi:hypothetical protein
VNSCANTLQFPNGCSLQEPGYITDWGHVDHMLLSGPQTGKWVSLALTCHVPPSTGYYYSVLQAYSLTTVNP